MQLNDVQIRYRAQRYGMIEPFTAHKQYMGALSYGLGHFGYDVRLGKTCKTIGVGQDCVNPSGWMNNSVRVKGGLLDKVRYNEHDLADFVLHPGEFVLAGLTEYLRIPSDVVAVVHDKSTLARLGIAVQNTVAEPGWHGYLTVELSNHGPLSVKLAPHMPIAQIIFWRGDTPPSNLYTGRYQGQKEGTTAIDYEAIE